MTDEHWSTLCKLREAMRPVTTDDLPHDGISREGICNRLRFLEAAGLAKTVGKRGRHHLWAAQSDNASVRDSRGKTQPTE